MMFMMVSSQTRMKRRPNATVSTNDTKATAQLSLNNANNVSAQKKQKRKQKKTVSMMFLL
jgi:hypothetical protein